MIDTESGGGLRVGIVGAGGVARRHAGTLAVMPDVALVGVTDPDAERAEDLAGAVGATPARDLDALLARGLDAVWVCVPPFAHGEVEERVAAAGVALFVEKPLGLDVAAAERVAAAVATAGVPTSVGHHWRSSTAVARARGLLAGRTVRLVSATWLDKVPPVPWWARRGSSGGQVVEQAVHVLDLARLLAGEVTAVHAVADDAPPDGGDVDSATAGTLRFAGGAVGTLAATCRLGWKHRAGVELYADDLALTVTEEQLAVRDGEGSWSVEVDPAEARTAADRAFVDHVTGREPSGSGVLVDYAEALRTHRLACALSESVASGAPVVLGA
ncbi:Gfo/Idh/MocA family protein [Actinomycetospora cinnamomea]|uniref:Putative dehydrogenase n=1 Tax=Actinomycetospora cinnamomea TaxID=663609 RepID=A0A2U1FAB2_9PSEU|nr:Gfo/Idh/MocA family oxidoreductase [Actinomycetospora cinnamomea]PVZ09108.1 putative dehydrogenase [Actinomycetospora cinnamomea]